MLRQYRRPNLSTKHLGLFALEKRAEASPLAEVYGVNSDEPDDSPEYIATSELRRSVKQLTQGK